MRQRALTGLTLVTKLQRLLVVGTLMVAICASAQDARAAVVQQVQSGTAVNTANGTQTITISSVDTTKSFLIFQIRSSGNRPVNSQLRGRLASSTTIAFERVTDEGAPTAINIQWYVATFGSGVRVQRGEVVMSANTVNAAIAAVASLSQAFVLWSATPIATDNETGDDDMVVGDLTSTTNLQFRTNAFSNHRVAWQVVEFTNAADINVQRGTLATMTGATLTRTATLGTAVDVSKTFVLAGFSTVGTGTDIGARMLRAQLTNSTTITFDRSISGSPDDMSEIAWQAIELKDGSTVQRGTANFASGASQATAAVVPRVNTTRAIAFGSVQESGQSMGRSAYAADDIVGVGTVTAALAPTQLTLNRNSTVAAADVGWFVVQFAGGNGFTVGSFTKTQGVAPASQAVAHGLGEVPKALILWTEGRSDETFSSAAAPGIAYRAASTGSAVSGVLTLTIPIPTGTMPEDAMIASIGFRPSTVVVTPPAGWVLERRTDNPTGSAHSLAVYSRIAGFSEPASHTWSFNASTGSAGGIMSFSGVDVTNPIDVENGQSTAVGLTHATPSVTTTGTNEMIVTTHAFSSGATWTPPTGMTEAFDVSANGVPDCCGMSTEGSYVLQAAAAATGTKTATASGDTDTGETHILALRPAPSGTAYFGFGMTDGTRSRSVSTSSQDAVGTSNASTRMANKALTMVRWGEVTVAEADLSSWNDTTFTLNWTTNDAASYVIHYIAIGGSDVSARVVDWTMRTTTGNQSVTGVGFEPTVVIHAHGGHTFTAALPASQAGSAFGLGVMDFDGDQWALANFSLDGVTPSNTQRGQQTDSSIYAFDQTPTVQKKASSPISPTNPMQPDGFTVNFTDTTSAAAARVFSLALTGINVKPGSFLKSTSAAPASQSVTGVGFRPNLVMLASVQNGGALATHSRFGLGASDGTTQASSAVNDRSGAAPTGVDVIDKTSKVFMKVNNNTSVINAEADLTSLDTDGFTLNWTTNDPVQTEILYLSLAPLAVTEVRLISFTAARDSRGTRLAWKTGYESDNLGFHVYRDVGGDRVRLTRALVAGSGLKVGSRNRSTTEQSYAYWDLDAAAQTPGAVYWLQDVDFNGKSTWHGPVTPETLPLTAEPTKDPRDENSRTLVGLGRGVGRQYEQFLTPAPDQDGAQLRLQSLAATPRETQWGIAAQPAVKLGVRAPGWYRVSQPTLLAAGLSAQIDPRTLRLYVDGVEHAVLVTGEADGQFDPADVIEFYGEGVDTPSTDTRVYWLVTGQGSGLRVQTAPASSGVAAATRFWGTIERKDRSIYFVAMENGDAENWFGAVISSFEAVDVNLTVRHVDASAPGAASLRVVLQGVTTTVNPVDHRVSVRVNGVSVGEVAFQGRAQGAATLTVPHDLLLEGANVVRFETLGGDEDITLFDTLRLSYWHTNDADDDQLRLTAEGQQAVTIGGFTGTARVVDITDPAAVLEVPTAAGPVPFSVTAQAPGSGTRTLLAFADATMATPAFVAANEPSTLHDAARAHDYLVVTHPDFASQVAPLVAHRTQQGLEAVLISIDDVYDEFSFGEKTPQALKDFLSYARTTWRASPQYVVLTGDATFDPRDYAGFGDADFVPTKTVAMAKAEEEAASDDWFADADNDGVPEIAIGRLPVRTPAQATALVAKIVGYDAEPDGPWTKHVTLVTDTDNPTVHFRANSEELASRLPAQYVAHAIDRDVIGTDAVRSELFSQVSQGQLIVNYLGHGSVAVWGGSGDLMRNADVANWTTTGSRLPFVVMMNCLNGFFHGIYDEESLAEALVRASGSGAVAVWASSSVTEPEPQGLMNQELYRQIFALGHTVLGDALTASKRAVSDVDVRRTWVFFGDPAMRLKGVPPPVATPPTAPVQPTLSASPSSVRFGVALGSTTVVTPSQSIRLTQASGSPVAWTAAADQPWILITDGSGSGSGQLTIGIAVSNLPSSGTASGTVTITALGVDTSPTVSVRLTVGTPANSTAPFGWIDTPQQGALNVTGAIAVTGWALDDVAVSKIQIYRDSVSPEPPAMLVYIGDATQVDNARPDVEAAYPLLPLNFRAGWGLMVLTNTLPQQGNGTFTLHAVAADLDGHRSLLGSRRFTGTNRTATKPFGTIDTPAQGAVISGTAYLNFGWALTPAPKFIETDGATIDVLVDGVAIGNVGALGARSDIQAVFPGYANTDQAVAAFVLDTTNYADGMHTIAWVVTDSDGVAEGIGSRFFTVANGSGVSPIQGVQRPVRQAVSAAVDNATAAATHMFVRRGYDSAAAREAVPVRDGTRRVLGRELERLEIHLARHAGSRYDGYLVVGGERRPLPVGSTLDGDLGIFSWQPGAGFLGRYDLLFVRTGPDGRAEPLAVEVVLQPRHRNASDLLMAVDLPQPGVVSSSFAVAGWAIDRGAKTGVGVTGVHVWAYPNPGSGAAPVFLGTSSTTNGRPDVAGFYGARFENSAYGLVVNELAPGVYDLAVFPYSAVTGQFEAARVVRVTVR